MLTFEQICKDIHQYILFDIQEWMDFRIFIKTSKSELGKLYYFHVLSVIKGATQKHLNTVIKNLGKRDIVYQQSSDYYSSLCDIIGIEKLPKNSLQEVKQKYHDVFEKQYKQVIIKFNLEIKQIKSEIKNIESQKASILNSPLRKRFERDLAVDEEKLERLELSKREAESRIETLEYEKGYVEEKLLEFCDIYNQQSIICAQKKAAIKICRDSFYTAELLFSSYKDIIEIFEDNIDRPYALFFRIKIYIIVAEANKLVYKNKYNKQFDAEKEYADYLGKCPKFDELSQMKHSDLNKYNQMLDQLIEDYSIVSKIKAIVQSCVCLRKRRGLLLKVLELFTQKETELFNSIVPVQIEGIFADYLKETTIFRRFSNFDIYPKAVLREKIDFLVEKDCSIYPEAVAYFKYYFNNLIRNRIAHGKYTGNAADLVNDEIFSKELLLDMGMVIYMSSRNSESDKMYQFVHDYQDYYSKIITSQGINPLYRPLLNDLTKEKTIMDYDQIERYDSMQVVYWLVNPYYEAIYQEVANDNHLIQLRQVFLSEDFWKYVLKQLEEVEKKGFNYLHFDNEFIAIINGLFSCNISPTTKTVLGKVHAKLKIIVGWERNEKLYSANNSKELPCFLYKVKKTILCLIERLHS